MTNQNHVQRYMEVCGGVCTEVHGGRQRCAQRYAEVQRYLEVCGGVSLQLIRLCGEVSLQLFRLCGGVSLQLGCVEECHSN